MLIFKINSFLDENKKIVGIQKFGFFSIWPYFFCVQLRQYYIWFLEVGIAKKSK